MAENLLRKEWSELDSHELKMLLHRRFAGPGQFHDLKANPNKLYLPLAGSQCHVVLTFRNKREIVSIERGEAFDKAKWNAISHDIEAMLDGQKRVGREFTFSSFRVTGSWRGERSGVQILPPPPDAPSAPFARAEHPFILEFPIIGAPDDLVFIELYRRQHEHRRLTLLLNVLLRPRIGFGPRRVERFWTSIEGKSHWVQREFSARLDEWRAEALSPPASERLAEVDPTEYHTNHVGVGDPFSVPSDLDASICRYRALSKPNAAKFDRAAFWLDMASRLWATSVSSSFAALVSAVEALTDRGAKQKTPGTAERFRSFFDKYAPGEALRERRKKMYDLRSDILHGSDLMMLDQDQGMDFGLNPMGWDEDELNFELWSIARIAMRNWFCEAPNDSAPA